MRIANPTLLISAIALTALAGCERTEAPQPAEETGAVNGEEAPQLTPVDGPPSTPAEPVLAGIAYADIEAELEAGAGCSVEQDGKNLLTAVEGDAIAKPYGTLRHFEFTPHEESENGELDALWGGGTFTAGAITIAVTPEEGEGEQIGEVNEREAEVVFTEEGQPSQTIAATWQCGS